jgi:hypothetical protein
MRSAVTTVSQCHGADQVRDGDVGDPVRGSG